MLLLDLPTELLRDIIQQSIPEGFENVMLSCKTIHAYGHELIKDYNAKREECRDVSFNINNNRNALYWLYRVAKEPSLPHYMRTVDLNGYKEYKRYSTLGMFSIDLRKTAAYREFDKLKDNEVVLQHIKELITSSPYLPDGDESFWIKSLLSDLGDADHYSEHDFFAGVFFLTLLPNTRTLTLPWNTSCVPCTFDARINGIHQYENVFNEIQCKARSLHVDASLSKLKRLEFLLQAEYDTKERLGFLAPFLILPNLETLFATSLVAVNYSYPFTWSYPEVNSNLRSIELVHCAMDASGVSELLAHMPHLISFRYSHGSKHHGVEAYWDAGAFVAAIGRHVGGQLQHLAITVEIHGLNEIMTAVTSMREFIRLETLEVDYAYFCGPSIESGEQTFLGKPPNPGHQEWTVDAIPSLQQILPSSLQSLIVFIEPNSDLKIDVARPLFLLFAGFASVRPLALPSLERCEVHCRGTNFGINEEQSLIHDYLKAEGVHCRFGIQLESPWRLAFRAQFGR
ncbi:hypothetical protein F5X99DRAFT_365734 [Biscogniauxia marginata]|nr:hypothetical protein F5X99DRAFT_365734 [Biscogniauxia marginata]